MSDQESPEPSAFDKKLLERCWLEERLNASQLVELSKAL